MSDLQIPQARAAAADEARAESFAAKKARLERDHLRAPAVRPATIGRGVHHLALICSDPDRTIAFYQDVVGFPLVEVFENRDYPGSTHFFLDIGNGNLLAFFDFPGLALAPWQETLGNMQHVAISVSPGAYAAVRSRLEARGIEYFGPDRGVEGSIYFRDPDGAQVELTVDPLVQMRGRALGTAG